MPLTYPTVAEVRGATATSLMRWHRCLPSPTTDEQRSILELVSVLLKTCTSDERIAASKEVGW